MFAKMRTEEPGKERTSARLRVLTLLYFLFFAFSVYCQLSKTDSLQKVLLTAKEDTNKVNALNQLANEFLHTDPQKVLGHAQQAFKLSEQLKWKKGIANSEHSMGYYYFSQGDYPNCLAH